MVVVVRGGGPRVDSVLRKKEVEGGLPAAAEAAAAAHSRLRNRERQRGRGRRRRASRIDRKRAREK